MSPSTWVLAAAGLGLIWWARQARRHPLRGETILISGGSRGLGLQLAVMLGRKGNRIALCGRDASSVHEAVNALRRDGVEAFGMACDVGDAEAVRQLVGEVQTRLGPIQTVVNNAGIINVGPLPTQTRADFEAAMDTMFWGAYNLTMEVLPAMRRAGRGRIVNITSIGGKVSVPHLLPYSCAKFAQVAFSEGLRAELAADGIAVHTIVPGLMRTGSYQEAARFKGKADREFAWFSIADNLPGLSISAVRAARHIINAVELGEAETVLTVTAQLLARFHGLLPGLTTDVLAWVSRLLPGPGGQGETSTSGHDMRARFKAPWFTTLTAAGEAAAARLQRPNGH